MARRAGIARALVPAAMLAAALGAAPPAARAQGYTIGWSTIDGGSATVPSSGGTFALRGTTGQPDGGVLQGGGFTVQGGFWGVPIPRLLGAEPAPAPALEPGKLSLAEPNPFTGSTQISFLLEHDGPANLDVYDVSGQRVRTLMRGTSAAGAYHVRWDGQDAAGRRMPPGIYFLRLDTGADRSTRRVVLVH